MAKDPDIKASLVCRYYSHDNLDAIKLLSAMHCEIFTAIDQKGWSEQEISDLLHSPGMHAVITTLYEDPVGFILFRTIGTEAEIIAIGTRILHQGKQIARHTLRVVIDDLTQNDVEQIYLEVREDNVKAIQLYTGLNFKLNGRRNKYYQSMSGKKIDALVFCLQL